MVRRKFIDSTIRLTKGCLHEHSAEVLGPAVFGIVYMKTIANFPRMIFVLTFAISLLVLILLGMIQLPKNPTSSHIQLGDLRSDVEGSGETERLMVQEYAVEDLEEAERHIRRQALA